MYFMNISIRAENIYNELQKIKMVVSTFCIFNQVLKIMKDHFIRIFT